MAIKLTYYTLVIPISTVLSKFPGGWEAWIEINKSDRCGALWCDEYLFARAAMDPIAAKKIQASWQGYGLTGRKDVDGEIVWEDFCVAECGGRCDWLSYCENAPAVYLSGSEPGAILGPLPRTPDKVVPPKQRALDVVGQSLVLIMVAAIGIFAHLYFSQP